MTVRERRRRETGAPRRAEESRSTLNRAVADQSGTKITGQGTLFEQVGEQRMVLSVSDLTRLIKGTLEENFVSVWVEGEISNLATPRSGHLYFTLKDERAQIRGVVFRGVASRLNFILKDGMAVLLHGKVTVYEPRGEYQIVADRVEPAGVGALQVAFQQLKEKLAKEGLFEESRKIPIPPHPRRVGVVTSPSGAAIHDIITVLSRRRALVDLLLMPVRVQGEGAAEEIAAAIADFNRIGGVDVLIVGRGGGSLEDLWAFNEEVVARAVAASRIPVISAVGHEVDFTICDFVADCRAATPSAAAEMVARSGGELSERIAGARERLALAVKGILERSRDRFRVSLRSLRDPAVVIGLHQIRLDDLWARLEASMMRGVGERRRALMEREKSLGILAPRSIAARRREHLDLLRERLRRGVEIGNASRRERLLRLDGALRSASPVRVLELRRLRCQGALERLERGMERYLGFRREALARAETLLGEVSPRGELQQGRERCRRLVERLQTAVTKDVTLRTKRLAQLCASLDSLSPLAVLGRGYALARRSDGAIVTDGSSLTVGELLRLRFGKGGALCRVDRVETDS